MKVRKKEEIEFIQNKKWLKTLSKFLSKEQINKLSLEEKTEILKQVNNEQEYLEYIYKYSHDLHLEKKEWTFNISKLKKMLKTWDEIKKYVIKQLHLTAKQREKFYEDTRWMSIMQKKEKTIKLI